VTIAFAHAGREGPGPPPSRPPGCQAAEADQASSFGLVRTAEDRAVAEHRAGTILTHGTCVVSHHCRHRQANSPAIDSTGAGTVKRPCAVGSDPRTRVYVERRLNQGRSKPEITRVLKRYVAREVYRNLPRP
jgi:hypothetical protein